MMYTCINRVDAQTAARYHSLWQMLELKVVVYAVVTGNMVHSMARIL